MKDVKELFADKVDYYMNRASQVCNVYDDKRADWLFAYVEQCIDLERIHAIHEAQLGRSWPVIEAPALPEAFISRFYAPMNPTSWSDKPAPAKPGDLDGGC